jgi:hypothetical protein
LVSRHVKGLLFTDYVRMIRGNKQVEWSRLLPPEDWALAQQRIEPNGWYPMASFERLGNAILASVAQGSVDAVRVWGRFSVDLLAAAQPSLLAVGDPIETINRFHVLRSSYFDFDALQVLSVSEGEAQVLIGYHMGPMAEEAAAHQTLGFFERLLEVAGAVDVFAQLAERSWAGDARTRLSLTWHAADEKPRRPISRTDIARIRRP